MYKLGIIAFICLDALSISFFLFFVYVEGHTSAEQLVAVCSPSISSSPSHPLFINVQNGLQLNVDNVDDVDIVDDDVSNIWQKVYQ